MRSTIPVVVVDSSVAYKWFDAGGEHNVVRARELLHAHSTGELVLVAPAHMPAEVMNGLRYAGLDEATLILAAEGLSEAEIVVVPLDEELMKAAAGLALTYDLTINDALFAALAVQLECELVTADRRQARVRECAVRLLA